METQQVATKLAAFACLLPAVAIESALFVNALLAFVDYVDTSEIDYAKQLLDAPKATRVASVQATGVHFTGTHCRSINDPMEGFPDRTCPMDLECQTALQEHMHPALGFDGCSSFVSWLLVSVTDGQDSITRCAFRYGTPASSTEEEVSTSKLFPGSHPVGSTVQVWTMGTNQCIVGVDSLEYLILKEGKLCGHSDGWLFHRIPCGFWTVFWFLVSLSPFVAACIILPLVISRRRPRAYGAVE